MAIPTFTPPVNPQPGYSIKRKPRVLMNSYGDGYSARVGDGINTMPRSASLTFGPLTRAQADAIDSFMVARGGYEAFWWTPPLDAAVSLPATKWICTEWSRSAQQWNAEIIDVQFTEVFDLGT